MNENRNMILFVVSMIFVFGGWHYFYDAPRQKQAIERINAAKAAIPQAVAQAEVVVPEQQQLPREDALKSTQRITFKNARMSGSISLTGARLDDTILLGYKESLKDGAPPIHLLSPKNAKTPYFIEWNWIGTNTSIHALPNDNTQWKTTGTTLTPDTPITLSWDNGHGLAFSLIYTLDDNYAFTVTQKVTNTSSDTIQLSPAQTIVREVPMDDGNMVVHQGPIGYLGDKLQEPSVDDLRKKGPQEIPSTGGWSGVTDKFWLSAIIPDQKSNVKTIFRSLSDHHVQTDVIGGPLTIAPGTSVEYTSHIFTGAKEVNLLDAYEQSLSVKHFDKAVDFGWLYFITKPTFYLLNYLNGFLGNMGIAILILTVLFKILMFHFANKSYRSMAKMKALRPQMERIKTRYDNDKLKMNQELMNLYKKEKVNPMAGCLPILVQIPIFFALYKVLFVSIEMRHAPFFGWIHDLSAPDPTTIFNLFGLIPWDPPSFLMFGLWPLIMGATMFLQQKMSPQPADPAQAKVMMLMPVMFTFMMAGFPAGLLIYWSWSNILGILQQWAITKISPQS